MYVYNPIVKANWDVLVQTDTVNWILFNTKFETDWDYVHINRAVANGGLVLCDLFPPWNRVVGVVWLLPPGNRVVGVMWPLPPGNKVFSVVWPLPQQ